MSIKIKKEFSVLNLITIPTVSMCTVMVGVYMNAQMAYMLEDKNMFKVPSS